MRTLVLLLLFVIPMAAVTQEPTCGPNGKIQLRTMLFFGLNKKVGRVSEGQWRDFLRTEVTPRFPQGFSVWNANGQWRRADGHIDLEKSKVFTVIHEDGPELRTAVQALIDSYKRKFEQEAVLWETSRVCASF